MEVAHRTLHFETLSLLQGFVLETHWVREGSEVVCSALERLVDLDSHGVLDVSAVADGSCVLLDV